MNIETPILAVGDVVRLHRTYFRPNIPPDANKYDEYEITAVQDPESIIFEPYYTGKLIRCHWDGNDITVNQGKENRFTGSNEGLVVSGTVQDKTVYEVNQEVKALRTYVENLIERGWPKNKKLKSQEDGQ